MKNRSFLNPFNKIVLNYPKIGFNGLGIHNLQHLTSNSNSNLNQNILNSNNK